MATPAFGAQAQSPLRRHLIDTRFGQMHVRIGGSGGTPLLMLHQSPVDGGQFAELAPMMASDRQVIVPDRMGFGHSDHPAEPPTMEEYALATADMLDALDLGACDVLAVHTGTSEAIALASLRPELVRRLCLVAIPSFTDDEREAMKERYAVPPAPTADGSHLMACWEFFAGHDEAQGAGAWSPELVHWITVSYMLSGTTPHAVFDYRAEQHLPRLPHPLLVVAPADDLLEHTRRAAALLGSDSRYVETSTLDSFGLFLSEPEVAAELARDFFDAA